MSFRPDTPEPQYYSIQLPDFHHKLTRKSQSMTILNTPSFEPSIEQANKDLPLFLPDSEPGMTPTNNSYKFKTPEKKTFMPEVLTSPRVIFQMEDYVADNPPEEILAEKPAQKALKRVRAKSGLRIDINKTFEKEIEIVEEKEVTPPQNKFKINIPKVRAKTPTAGKSYLKKEERVKFEDLTLAANAKNKLEIKPTSYISGGIHSTFHFSQPNSRKASFTFSQDLDMRLLNDYCLAQETNKRLNSLNHYLQKKLDKLKPLKEILAKENEELRRAIESYEHENPELQNQVLAYREEIMLSTSLNSKLTNENHELLTKLANAEMQLGSLKKLNSNLRRVNKELKAKLEDQDEDIRNLKEKLNSIEVEYKETLTKFTELQTTNDKLTRDTEYQISELETKLKFSEENFKRSRQDSKKEIESAQLQIKSLIYAISEYQAKNMQLELENKEKDSRIQELIGKVDNSKKSQVELGANLIFKDFGSNYFNELNLQERAKKLHQLSRLLMPTPDQLKETREKVLASKRLTVSSKSLLGSSEDHTHFLLEKFAESLNSTLILSRDKEITQLMTKLVISKDLLLRTLVIELPLAWYQEKNDEIQASCVVRWVSESLRVLIESCVILEKVLDKKEKKVLLYIFSSEGFHEFKNLDLEEAKASLFKRLHDCKSNPDCQNSKCSSNQTELKIKIKPILEFVHLNSDFFDSLTKTQNISSEPMIFSPDSDYKIMMLANSIKPFDLNLIKNDLKNTENRAGDNSCQSGYITLDTFLISSSNFSSTKPAKVDETRSIRSQTCQPYQIQMTKYQQIALRDSPYFLIQTNKTQRRFTILLQCQFSGGQLKCINNRKIDCPNMKSEYLVADSWKDVLLTGIVVIEVGTDYEFQHDRDCILCKK